MASRGHRVIANAQRLLPSSEYSASTKFTKTEGEYPSTDYCFVSLTSLEDPPKHGVREAIGTLRMAGIKVMMVTGKCHVALLLPFFVDICIGDHPKTAEAIARKINLILGDTKESLAARTGRTVDEIYDDEVQAVVVHGDDIDGLQGWQWDQSQFLSIRMLLGSTTYLNQQFSRRMRSYSLGLPRNISSRS